MARKKEKKGHNTSHQDTKHTVCHSAGHDSHNKYPRCDEE